ncbi:27481_t:CDS:2, partial [Dentiscutata erythropus]
MAISTTSQPTYGPSPIFDYEKFEKQEQNKGSIVEHKVINKDDPKYTEAKKKSTEHRYSTMNFRISPRKLRFLANQIAGKPINEAIKQMEFSHKRASRKIMNSLITARDHAWRYKMMDADNVFIDQAFVGKGLYRKKPNYGARGRFSFLKIKKAHMKYILKVKKPEMDLGIGNKRTAKTFKMISESQSWLENERRKFESFTEENFRDFSIACQQEVDWLKNYLRDIIARSKKIEITRPNDSNIPQNSQKTIAKRLVKTKPEIKSLVRAAAIKKEQEKHEKKTAAKEWETKRLAASQRRQEEQQKRLQIAKQREEEWKRKANFIPDSKKKEEEGLKKKQVLQKTFEIKKKKDGDLILHSEDSSEDDSSEDIEKYKNMRPSWCQPHNIKVALIRQASIDPETIFGSIQPLDMS